MRCECLSDIDSPYCPATTFQEVRDLLPKGCDKREFSDWVETYCHTKGLLSNPLVATKSAQYVEETIVKYTPINLEKNCGRVNAVAWKF